MTQKRENREYQICKAIAIYMRLQYPKIIFHYDLAGLNLSRAQAGMTKVIQGGKGYPDLFIAEPRANFHGLFIEVKKEGTVLWKVKGGPATDHIGDQIDMLNRLTELNYYAEFGVGFDHCKELIDNYLLGNL